MDDKMEFLFHYTHSSSLKAILANNTIKVNNINKTNDPYECKSFDWIEVEMERTDKWWNEEGKYLHEKELLEEKKERIEEENEIIDEEDAYFSKRKKHKRNKSIDNFYDDNVVLNDADFEDDPRTWEEIDKKLKESFEEDAIEMQYRKQFNTHKNRMVRTSCFALGDFDIDANYEETISSGRERPGFYYPRMWAQYANRSSGACIVFNKNLLDKCFDSLQADYTVFKGKVTYVNMLDDSYQENIQKARLSEFKYSRGNIIKHLIKNVELYFLTKDTDWKDEREYRYLIINKDSNMQEKEIYLDIKNSIHCIILGENFRKNRDEITNYCSKRNIPLYHIVKSLTGYSLRKNS
ncbi:hypothetical protein FACS189461_1670 [Spirochaetia bacterium]|nr:hypothetical protein FACS189461_1670 [Spirochaetia bacterium]